MIDDARLAELEALCNRDTVTNDDVDRQRYEMAHEFPALLAELRTQRRVVAGLREHYMRVVTSMGGYPKWDARYDFDNERPTNRRGWIAGHERGLDALITKLTDGGEV